MEWGETVMNNIRVEPIGYETWKLFEDFVKEGTVDQFTLDITDRMGDVFIDAKDMEEMLEPGEVLKTPFLGGIFLEDQLVGLIDEGETTLKNDAKACTIPFLVIHPSYQNRGIGKTVVRQVIEKTNHTFVEMFPITHSAKVLCTKCGFEQNGTLARTWDHYIFDKNKQ